MTTNAGPVLGGPFLARWILGNGFSWIIGMALAWFLNLVLGPLTQGLPGVLTWGIGGMILGVTFGVNQWFIFRPYGRHKLLGEWANAWIIVTVLGWGFSLAVVVGMGAGDRLGFATTGSVVGILVGIAQYFVLRLGIRQAEWWALITTLAWVVALAPIDFISESLGFALAGFIYGTVSGAGLIWLTRRSNEQNTAVEVSKSAD